MKNFLILLVGLAISTSSFSQANDECINAETLTLLEDVVLTVSNDFSVSTASFPSGNCFNNDIDVWYTFTSPVDGNIFFNFSTGFLNAVVYDICDGTEIVCLTNDGFLNNVNLGQSYILRLSSASTGTYSCNITATSASTNDECVNAETINLVEGIATSVSINGNAVSPSFPAGACFNDDRDLWYSFTSPVNGSIYFNFSTGNLNGVIYDACGGTEVLCMANDEFLDNVTLGQNFIFRLSRQGIGTATCLLTAVSTAANDECINAEAIVLEEDIAANVTINGIAASPSMPVGTCFNDIRDVWFTFTSPVNGNIFFNFSTGFLDAVVYDICDGTEIVCLTNDGFLNNVSLGQSFLFRLGKSDAASANCLITAVSEASNDECVNAETISIMEAIPITVSVNGSAATPSQPPGTCYNNDRDVWYAFSSPVDGNIYFDFSTGFLNVVIYDACSGNEIICMDNDAFLDSVSIGQSFLLRLSRSDAGQANCTITAISTAENNDCINADTITLVSGLGTTVSINGTAATPSFPNGTCFNAERDVWFTFTAPVTGNIFINFSTGFLNGVVYDACDGSEILCLTNDGFLNNVNFGQRFLFRLSRTGAATSTCTFTIESIAFNDDCINAESITLIENEPTLIGIDGNAATPSFPSGSCFNNDRDVWFTFTSPVNGNLYFNFVSSALNGVLYDACNGNELLCLDNDGFLYNATQGQELILRLGTSTATVLSCSITAYSTIQNNDCASAEEIFVASIGNCSDAQVSFQIGGATNSMKNPSCDISNKQDAWFLFESPITGSVTLNSNFILNNFAVYDSCTGAEIACFENDGSIPGLVLGQTYLLQVFRPEGAGIISFCLEGSYEVSEGIENNCIDAIPETINNDNNNQWVPLLDSDNNIIAAINARGQNLGPVNTSLYIDPMSTRIFNGLPYLKRTVEINTSDPINPVLVRLYISGSEFDSLAAVDPNLQIIQDLEIMKSQSLTCNDPYDGSGIFVPTIGRNYNTNDYYIQFSVFSFSSFFPTTQDIALPLDLIEFTGAITKEGNLLSWLTASEINVKEFEIERSNNGVDNWQIIQTRNANNHIGTNQYQFIDTRPLEKAYYRLKIIDLDGYTEYSKTIFLNNIQALKLKVFPNPVENNITIFGAKEAIQIIDLQGRIKLEDAASDNVNVSRLAPGVYFVKSGSELIKFVKL